MSPATMLFALGLLELMLDARVDSCGCRERSCESYCSDVSHSDCDCGRCCDDQASSADSGEDPVPSPPPCDACPACDSCCDCSNSSSNNSSVDSDYCCCLSKNQSDDQLYRLTGVSVTGLNRTLLRAFEVIVGEFVPLITGPLVGPARADAVAAVGRFTLEQFSLVKKCLLATLTTAFNEFFNHLLATPGTVATALATLLTT